jgi:ribosomal protein S18 acetylase RimI-like enzyme
MEEENSSTAGTILAASLGSRHPWTIRPAALADVETCAMLCGQLGYPATADQVRLRLEQILADSDNAVLVAEGAGGQVLGWVQVYSRHLLVADRDAEIGGLVVAEGQRSQGLGQQLIAEAEAWARARGCRELNVRSNVVRERAHHFYERIGYTLLKTQKTFRKPL